jgi:phosphoenolpyruvate synthase/pyruvate phosphate dikinase
MAVVVQEMVRADAAGVLFTCDPVTVNPAYMHISCNAGLGEVCIVAARDVNLPTLRK